MINPITNGMGVDFTIMVNNTTETFRLAVINREFCGKWALEFGFVNEDTTFTEAKCRLCCLPRQEEKRYSG